MFEIFSISNFHILFGIITKQFYLVHEYVMHKGYYTVLKIKRNIWIF